MKTSKEKREIQKRFLEIKIKSLSSPRQGDRPPPSGWIKAIREALGMSSKALARRLGNNDSAGVLRLEERESKKKITLELLERAAKAMDCHLVYYVIPDNKERSLEKILFNRAYKLAKAIVKETKHSMRLEDQKAEGNDEKEQIYRLAKQLKEKFDPRLWED